MKKPYNIAHLSVLSFCAALFATAAFAGDVVYVAPNGDDTADGKTWATAWATPQKAIDAYPEATVADGIKIYLGEGTFTDAQTILNLTNAVEVIGAGMGKTILKPDNSAAQPTVINACAGAVVRGVTITGNSKARALKFVGSAGIVEQCCIGTNTMGGVWFSGNACSGLVSRCEIACNTGADKGGGVFFDDVRTAYAIVENSLIVGNQATGSNPTQNGGGAVFNNGANSEGTLRYCTIVNNHSPVGAVNNYYGMGNRCRFYNCVFYGNTCASTASTPEFSPGFYGSAYTVKNCYTLDGRGTNPIVGRINFVDADSGDYHLRLSSCARNAGFLVSAEDVNKLDLDGNGRVVGDLPDAGCYEFQVPVQTVCDISASGDEGVYGESSVTFTGLVSGSGDYAYDWQLLDAAGEVAATGSGTTFEPELSGYGYFSVRLDVTNLADAGDTATYTLKKAVLVRPNVTYVVPEDAPNAGAGSYPYASWETATTDWNAAIAAVRDGGEVVFSNGTYVLDEQIQVERPITLMGLGGYSETTLKRSSTGNARLVYLTCKEAVVRGFTITGGNPNENWTYGVGVRISGKGGTLADCRVTANNASQYGGGAVYVNCADGRVTRCLIDNNKYTGSYSFTAGGVLMEAGQIDSSLILNNKGWQTGGVLLSGSAKMYNCTILGNTAGSGSNDYKGGGVGVGVLSGDGGIRNCIVKDNVGNAGASSTGGFPEWFITTTDAAKIDAIKAAVRNCCFGKNFANPLGVDWVDADPLFNGADDYSLNANSELIDAGTDYDGVDSDTDLAGLPRKSGKDVDVGAYEFDFSKRTVDFSVEPAMALAGDVVTFSGLVSGGDEGVAYTYVWTLQNLDRLGDPIVLNGQKLSLDTLSPGRYSATLTVTETESGADVGAKTLPLVTTIGAKTVYVVTAAGYEGDSGEWPFDEWEKATTNALTAVESAQAGATVLLGDGEHVIDAELVIEKAITVKGLNGWEKTMLRHNTKAGKARVVGINNQEAKVEGLSITGGNLETVWEKGLAVKIGTQGGTLSKCRVTGNVFPTLGVEGVVFVDYSAAIGGIGRIENCIIDNNSHWSYQYYQTGGGLLLNGGVARNCLLFGNVGCQYGGIGVFGPATVQNCTVVSNVVQYGKGSTSTSGAGGINFATSSTGARIENCIFAFNRYGNEPSDFLACGIEAVTNAANAAISTCLFTDGSEAGANQIMGLPVFRKIGATAVDGNWRLRSRSPGYKTGLYDASWMADGVDFYGEPRTKHEGPQGPVVDIGAAEADWRGSGLTILVW